jgi:hypothetical protein
MTQYPSIWLLILNAATDREKALVTQTDIFDIMTSLIHYDIHWRFTNATLSSSLLSWCCEAKRNDNNESPFPLAIIEWLCAAGTPHRPSAAACAHHLFIHILHQSLHWLTSDLLYKIH